MAKMRKAMKKSEKISMIADGMDMADMRKEIKKMF